MGTGQYAARPEAMRSAVGNVGGIIMRASGTLADFEQLTPDPVCFASIGRAVGCASTRMQGQQVRAMRSLLSLLQSVSGLVQRSADNYQNADVAVAASYSGGRAAATDGPRIWSRLAAAALAAQAAQDSRVGAVPTPHRAESVIGYLASAGLGQLGQAGQGGPLSLPIGSAGDLTAWLAESPAHQAQLGVVAVYSGAARDLGDTPGGLRPGDLVFIEPGPDAADQHVTLGVVGDAGGLHNHGRLSVDFGGVAQVHVYRPAGGSPGRQMTTETPVCL